MSQLHKNNPIPQGKYIPANRYGQLIYSAGMTPRKNGTLILSGKVLSSKPLEYYKDAVIQAVDNALVAIQNTIVNEEKLSKIISMTVYVNAESDYTTHTKLADIASEYLIEQLGEIGIVSRTAIGVSSLPGNAPLEIQLVAAVE